MTSHHATHRCDTAYANTWHPFCSIILFSTLIHPYYNHSYQIETMRSDVKWNYDLLTYYHLLYPNTTIWKNVKEIRRETEINASLWPSSSPAPPISASVCLSFCPCYFPFLSFWMPFCTSFTFISLISECRTYILTVIYCMVKENMFLFICSIRNN